MKMDISRPSGTEVRDLEGFRDGPGDDHHNDGFIGSFVRYAISALVLGGAGYFVINASLTTIFAVGGALLVLFIALALLLDSVLNDTPLGS